MPIQKLRPMMLPDPEDIDADLIGGLHFSQKIGEPFDWRCLDTGPGIAQDGRETVNAYLH